MKKHGVVVSLLMCLLSGCQDQSSSDYLLLHPISLMQAVANCQSDAVKTDAQENQCKTVMIVASQMAPLITELQLSPEKFGMRILQNEMTASQLKQALRDAEQQLATLHKTNPSPEALQDTTNKVTMARNAYEEQRNKINVLLAVASLNGPE